MMYLIVLPQALTITIPNIVTTYIGLFKDTTLVVIVGIFDFLRTVEVSRIDPKWAAPTTSATGYAFAAIFYFTSATACRATPKSVEARLAKGDRRYKGMIPEKWEPVFGQGSCAKGRVGRNHD